MTVPPLPGDVRRFLLATIPTVPHLEALLLLRERPQLWTPAQLATRLYVDASTAAILIADLAAAGLLACDDDGCRYAPRDPAVAADVDAVAALYARHMVVIAELIHSTSDRKAHRFADAFRWRKEP
jgi:Mn-dependent DtxR family transcriptional regulator